METKDKILIVEDDETIAGAVAKHLEGWGYHCVCATDFAHVTREFAAHNPQLVLLDISLPFYNGFYWCAEIRKLSSVPILFLSSAGDNMSLVMAINMGGDDFLAKPFDFDVLVAKVQAQLRRTYDFSAGASLVEHRGVILNLSDASVTCHGEAKTNTVFCRCALKGAAGWSPGKRSCSASGRPICLSTRTR